ncbi:MAG: hypothetical protein WCL71_18450, partial [Deltaproteobacteria bacterium]
GAPDPLVHPAAPAGCDARESRRAPSRAVSGHDQAAAGPFTLLLMCAHGRTRVGCHAVRCQKLSQQGKTLIKPTNARDKTMT